MSANVFEEPPDFDEPGENRGGKKAKPIRIDELETSIRMLQQHLDGEDIEPLISALQALKAEPDSRSCFTQLVEAFDNLGPRQGAVLTYAPYVSILLSNESFGQ